MRQGSGNAAREAWRRKLLMPEQELDQELGTPSIGERLKQAREAKGLSLEDIASQTRIPIRHLQHIEREEWDALPAPTYAIGFARSYGNIAGLDGAEIGRELRDQLGGTRSRVPAPEYYEPADPARVPPRSLAILAALIAAVLVVGYLVWRSSLAGEEQANEVAAADAPAPKEESPGPAQAGPGAQPLAPQAAAGQPVTLTAIGPVWLRVYQESGPVILERTLAPGETFQIPPAVERPMLRVGAPEALRVTVGQTVIPQLGPAGRPVGNISARPEDLIARARGQAGPPPAT